jgi:thiosulfate/3-mercaptopyruvate sulfurtransferase
MAYETLVSSDELSMLLQSSHRSDVLVLDCSFDLGDIEAGHRAYLAQHILGAHYVDLAQTLSGPRNGSNGRHPLPAAADFAGALCALGAHPHTQVVAYDQSEGMYAARLWWLLRWTGHRRAAVLDGGLAAWIQAGHTVTDSPTAAPVPGSYTLRAPLSRLVSFEQVLAQVGRTEQLVVDARASDRFQGKNESLDPVAGHIPGALNRPFRDNLRPDGRFKPAAVLRQEWQTLLGNASATQVVNQCGSGVTACHNLLAMEVAGLQDAALYAGSWSEWCSRPEAPVATG